MRCFSKCFVYIIGQKQGPVKIGISSNPESRAAHLQVGCPFKISVLDAFEFASREDAKLREKVLHDGYRNDCLSGEWFRLDIEQAREAVRYAVNAADFYTSIGAM